MMAGPPATVWVEVANELLADLGDWSKPVQVRIHDPRPNGQVQMELRIDHDLALALELLDQLATWCPCPDEGQECANTMAHELLVRHGIRQP